MAVSNRFRKVKRKRSEPEVGVKRWKASAEPTRQWRLKVDSQ